MCDNILLFLFQMHSNVRDIPQTDFGIKSENVLTQPNNYTTGPYDFSLSSLDELIQDNGSLFDSTPASLTGGSELLNPQTGFQNSNSGVENSLANGSDPSKSPQKITILGICQDGNKDKINVF